MKGTEIVVVVVAVVEVELQRAHYVFYSTWQAFLSTTNRFGWRLSLEG